MNRRKSHDVVEDLNNTEPGFHPAPRAEDMDKFAGDGFDAVDLSHEYNPSPTTTKDGTHERVPVGNT